MASRSGRTSRKSNPDTPKADGQKSNSPEQSNESGEIHNPETALRIAKYEAEIAASRRWWGAPLIQATPGILLVLSTWYVAKTTGILDAQRVYLATQNERLQMTEIKLTSQETAKNAQLADVEERLRIATTSLQIRDKEANAIRRIYSLMSHAVVAYLPNEDGFLIRLSGNNWSAWDAVKGHSVDFEYSGNDVITADSIADEPTITRSRLHDILTFAADLPKVSRLELSNIAVGTGDLSLIGKLTELRALSFEDCGLTDEDMTYFPPLTKLSEVRFKHGRFTSPFALADCSSLQHIDFEDTPISDDGLEFLKEFKNRLSSVGIVGSSVTDKGLEVFEAFPRLRWINVANSRVSAEGVRRLLSSDISRHVTASPLQFTEEFARVVSKSDGVCEIVRKP